MLLLLHYAAFRCHADIDGHSRHTLLFHWLTPIEPDTPLIRDTYQPLPRLAAAYAIIISCRRQMSCRRAEDTLFAAIADTLLPLPL